jgi:MFS family permease
MEGAADPAVHGARNIAVAAVARGFMSAGRALAGVAVPIYLATEGYSAARLGVLFGVAAATSALMSVAIGFLSDRLGRKPFMVVLPLLAALAGVGYAVSVNPVVVFVGGALGSFGRGGGAGGGMVGPYQPAEQALVAASVGAARRTATFGRLAFASSLGALCGGLITGLISPSHPSRSAALAAYRPLFLALAGCAAVAGLLALLIVEPGRTGLRRQAGGPLFPRRSQGCCTGCG